MRHDPSLIRYAYHEAGHGIVGKLLRRPVGLIWISVEAGGACIVGVAHEPADYCGIFERSIILAAGEAAEKFATDRPPSLSSELAALLTQTTAADEAEHLAVMTAALASPEMRSEIAPDFEQVTRLIAPLVQAGIARGDSYLWFRRAKDAAEGILAEHRNKLNVIAAALLQNGQICGRDFQLLFDAA